MYSLCYTNNIGIFTFVDFFFLLLQLRAAGAREVISTQGAEILSNIQREPELIKEGHLQPLPKKYIKNVMVKLDSQEQLIYDKIKVLSRSIIGFPLKNKNSYDSAFCGMNFARF